MGKSMTDVTAGQSSGGFSILGIGSWAALAKRGDIALAVGVMTILVVLIMPLPSVALDMFLAFSIILSVLILMTTLFIHAPLEFSAFPTVLLIATMLRLSLNLASTRLILAHGHEGTAAGVFVWCNQRNRLLLHDRCAQRHGSRGPRQPGGQGHWAISGQRRPVDLRDADRGQCERGRLRGNHGLCFHGRADHAVRTVRGSRTGRRHLHRPQRS